MGTSTDAILFYGYCWDEEDRTPWETESNEADDSWESRYAATKGCLPPTVPFPPREVPRTRENNYSSTPTDYSPVEQAIIDQYVAYWEAKRTLVDSAPCLVGTHCSGSCPMYYVAATPSVIISHRGSPSEIASLVVDPSWPSALAEFCAVMKISVGDKKPAWWLVSDWSA